MQVTEARHVKNTAADLLESAASALREKASGQGGPMESLGFRAADKIGVTAGYLRRTEVEDMLQDAEKTARRHPEAALVAAAAVGFLLGSAVRNR